MFKKGSKNKKNKRKPISCVLRSLCVRVFALHQSSNNGKFIEFLNYSE